MITDPLAGTRSPEGQEVPANEESSIGRQGHHHGRRVTLPIGQQHTTEEVCEPTMDRSVG